MTHIKDLRLLLVLLTTVLITLSSDLAVAANPGELTQLSSPYSCISESGNYSCQNGKGLDGASRITASPDGKNIYAVSQTSSAITTFIRDTDGNLTQLSNLVDGLDTGCIDDESRTTNRTCTHVPALGYTSDVVVSPDGKNVYVTARTSDSLTTFSRNPENGELTWESCISGTGYGGACTAVEVMDTIDSVVISPNGESLYVTAEGSEAIVAFDRNTSNGELTETSCISNDGSSGACTASISLREPNNLAISPDGRNIYATSTSQYSVYGFSRDSNTGDLTPLSDNYLALGVSELNVSPDGKNVYVVNPYENSIQILDRDDTTGVLTKKSGTTGCLKYSPGSSCLAAQATQTVQAIAVSPNNRTVFTGASTSDSVSSFTRDPATGELQGNLTSSGCIAHDNTYFYSRTCTDGTELDYINDVVVSPDGKNLYATARNSDSVSSFSIAVPELTTDTETLTFANTELKQSNSSTLTVTNSGESDLTVSNLTLSGLDSTVFSITNESCINSAIAPGETCSITVTFTPTSAGSQTTSLLIESDDPEGTHTVTLSGVGTDSITSTNEATTPKDSGTGTDTPLTGPKLSLVGSKSIAATKKGVVKLKLTCQGNGGEICNGKITLKVKSKKAGKTKTISIQAGKTTTFKYKLSNRYLKKLKRKRKLSVTALLKASGDTVISSTTKKYKISLKKKR